MSTFPFVQIKGAFALPQVGALARLPASFGHEWSLTPPHFSLRAELRALYAAIMRTVCLSAAAFRAAARWDAGQTATPQPPGPAAAPVGPKPVGGPAASRIADARPPLMSSHAAAPFERRKLAGGAVAIGGAALLAWIVGSHAPHDSATVMSAAMQQPDVEAADAAAALPRTADATSAEAGASHPADKPAEAAAPSPVQIPATTAVSERPSTQTNDRVRAEPYFDVRRQPQAASSTSLLQRQTRGSERATNRAAGQRLDERGVSARHEAHEFAPYREAEPVTAHRSHDAYSSEQRYSPRQTGANRIDEYASILSYAKTYAPAAAPNRAAIPADSTDWVNHVSQRRITEVPERFAQ